MGDIQEAKIVENLPKNAENFYKKLLTIYLN